VEEGRLVATRIRARLGIAQVQLPPKGRHGLREFGIVTGGAVAGLFGLLFPWLFGNSLPTWPWVVAGALTAWALIAPASLRPVYVGWMRFGYVMSRITTPLILCVVFYGVITPIARVRALLRRDPLARRFDPGAASYRVASVSKGSQDLEKPY
jgi:hypothetical protein